jgi:hypothetical protein
MAGGDEFRNPKGSLAGLCPGVTFKGLSGDPDSEIELTVLLPVPGGNDALRVLDGVVSVVVRKNGCGPSSGW